MGDAGTDYRTILQLNSKKIGYARLYWCHPAQDRTHGVNKVIKYEFHKWLRSYRGLCPKKDFSYLK
jgi:hypothetical protein